MQTQPQQEGGIQALTPAEVNMVRSVFGCTSFLSERVGSLRQLSAVRAAESVHGDETEWGVVLLKGFI